MARVIMGLPRRGMEFVFNTRARFVRVQRAVGKRGSDVHGYTVVTDVVWAGAAARGDGVGDGGSHTVASGSGAVFVVPYRRVARCGSTLATTDARADWHYDVGVSGLRGMDARVCGGIAVVLCFFPVSHRPCGGYPRLFTSNSCTEYAGCLATAKKIW